MSNSSLPLHAPAPVCSAGLGSIPEGSSSGGQQLNRQSAVVGSGLVSPLLLLDALKINLHLEAPEATTASGGYSREQAVDSDEESDAGESTWLGGVQG